MIIIISFLLISVGVALLPHLVYLVAKIISLIAHFHVAYKPFGYTALGLVGLWLILFCWGYFFGRYFHEVKPVTIACKGLPKAYDGFRIVQISDLHLDGWVGHEDELLGIVNEINALKPDAIVFTGDLVSLDESELKPFIPILSKLKSPNGVVSIMGNHDYLPYNRSLSDKERAYKISDLQRMQREDLGWHLLLNDNCPVFPYRTHKNKADENRADQRHGKTAGYQQTSIPCNKAYRRSEFRSALKESLHRCKSEPAEESTRVHDRHDHCDQVLRNDAQGAIGIFGSNVKVMKK